MADDPMVKVTIRLPKSLVQGGKLLAMSQGVDFQDVVASALKSFFASRRIVLDLAKKLGTLPKRGEGK